MARSSSLFALLLAFGCTSLEAARVAATPAIPSYDLELAPDFDFFTFKGRTHIRFANPGKEPLAEAPLELYPNAKALTPDGTRNVVVRAVTVDGRTATFTQSGLHLRVKLPAPIPAGGLVDLDVAFDGCLPRMRPGESDLLAQGLDQLGEIFGGLTGKEGKGLVGDYGTFAYGHGVLSFGNWYPQLPAYLHGRFQLADDTSIGDMGFADVADYRLSVVAPAGVIVACGGQKMKEEKLPDGAVRTTFDAPKVRNLAVAMSRDFVVTSKRLGPVSVNAYTLKDDAAEGRKALEAAAAALAFYQKAFGPYPWRQLDVVEAPLKGGAGGVEFTGLVSISEGLYEDLGAQFGPLLSVLSQLGGLGGSAGQGLPDFAKGIDELLEFVVAHEVAHQWWNAAVGSDPRTSPFLDEALANFSAVRYFEAAHGAEAAARQRELELALNYQLYRAMGGADGPVSAPASTFPSTLAYSAIVYGKGALFFEELCRRHGTPAVLKALSTYYGRGRLVVMDHARLRACLEQGIPAPRGEVAELWRRWIEEAHGDEDIGRGAMGELLAQTPLGSILGSGGKEGGLEKLLGGALQDLLKQLDDAGGSGDGE